MLNPESGLVEQARPVDKKSTGLILPLVRMDVEAEIPVASTYDRPGPNSADVRLMGEADIPLVARSLAEAFYDDPHMSWIVRNDDRRLQRLGDGFATFSKHLWLPGGEAYTHKEKIGAAIWKKPNAWEGDPRDELRLLPAMLRIAPFDLRRLTKVMDFTKQKHKEVEAKMSFRPHYYLLMLGVTPENGWQGRGWGSELVKPVLDKCDTTKTPAYLEASTERNRDLYKRLGFSVVEEVMYEEDSPPMWLMWREPQK